MSETPRNDESPEYRDPTAPSDPTQQVPTGDTQHLPTTPEPGSPSTPPVPPAPPGAQPPAPGYGPPGAAQPAPQPPQNPYAAPPAQAAQNPYGAPPPPPQFQPPYPSQEQVQSGGYGPGYGPGYAAPPVQYAQPRSMSGNTIALLVVSGLATFGCLFGIPALIFAIIAATKTHEPAEQAKYTRYGWIAFGVTLLLVVIGIIAVIAIGVSSGSSTYDSSY